MDVQQQIQARLASDPEPRRRRAEMLTAFVAALEQGGVESAAAVLSRPLNELCRGFETTLAELERLL
jgi:hypothetical protein